MDSDGELAKTLGDLRSRPCILTQGVGEIRMEEMKNRSDAEQNRCDERNGEREEKHAIERGGVGLCSGVRAGHEAHQRGRHDWSQCETGSGAGQAQQAAFDHAAAKRYGRGVRRERSAWTSRARGLQPAEARGSPR